MPPTSPGNSGTILGSAGAAGQIAAPALPVRRGIAGSVWEPYLYLFPAALIFTLFVGVPVVGTVVFSLVHYNGVGPLSTVEWAGIVNYTDAFTDPKFWEAAWHNLILIPYYVVLPAILGLIPAALVQGMKLRGSAIFRVGLFLPYIMPGILIGVVWRWLLNPVFGPINDVLKRLGFDPPTWLSDFTWTLPTVGVIGAWAAYGFCYVVFLAGMQKIPTDLYEAARLDGASGWEEFRSVTIPGLRREIAVVVSVNLINALRAFDVIKATTDGGPGRQTEVVALYMINSAFGVNRVGYGAALAVLLAVITLALSLLTLRLFGDGDE